MNKNYDLYGIANIDPNRRLYFELYSKNYSNIYKTDKDVTQIDIVTNTSSGGCPVENLYNNWIAKKINNLAKKYHTITIFVDHEAYQHYKKNGTINRFLTEIEKGSGLDHSKLNVISVLRNKGNSNYSLFSLIHTRSHGHSRDKDDQGFSLWSCQVDKDELFTRCDQAIMANTMDGSQDHCVITMGHGLAFERFREKQYEAFYQAIVKDLGEDIHKSEGKLDYIFPNGQLRFEDYHDQFITLESFVMVDDIDSYDEEWTD